MQVSTYRTSNFTSGVGRAFAFFETKTTTVASAKVENLIFVFPLTKSGIYMRHQQAIKSVVCDYHTRVLTPKSSCQVLTLVQKPVDPSSSHLMLRPLEKIFQIPTIINSKRSRRKVANLKAFHLLDPADRSTLLEKERVLVRHRVCINEVGSLWFRKKFFIKADFFNTDLAGRSISCCPRRDQTDEKSNS